MSKKNRNSSKNHKIKGTENKNATSVIKEVTEAVEEEKVEEIKTVKEEKTEEVKAAKEEKIEEIKAVKEEKTEEVKTVKEEKRKEPEAEKRSSHKEEKLRFTLLLIPNNHHRVRELRFSADFLITVTSVAALIAIIFVMSITLGAKQWQEYKDTVEEQYDTIKTLQDENIVLESEVEELTATLREAKVAIDVSKNIQQQEAAKQTEATKPSALPIAGGTSLPTEYTEDKGYVEFNAPAGGKVVATADGVISMAIPNDQYGYIVKVDHGNGYVTTYMIDCVPQVNENDKVIKGSTLFTIGDNGATLAYQITFNDVAINPMSVIEVNG